MITKSELRKKQKLITDNIPENKLKIKSDIIFDLILSSNILNNAECIFVYYSFGREVQTERLIDELLKLDKTVLIPKCDTGDETMIAVQYNNSSNTVINAYGIKETEFEKEYTGKIDLAIVPGIAFDIYGNRLGRGKGYYDKFFEKHNICKAGLCYSENLMNYKIPHNADDIPMDYVISDRGVIAI